jgi:peptide/nickel transport system substrate-binding protein
MPRRPSRIVVSRRAVLRGMALVTASTALLAACAPRSGPRPLASTPMPTAPPPIVEARPSATPRSGSAPRGGTLMMARTVDATNLDPHLMPSISRQRITMLTYNNLVKLSSEAAIQPDLAETWRVSPDGKQIDFALRKGVMWHPPVSRELVADDVRFSYERLLHEAPGRSELAIVEGIEALDKYNVRFYLSAANAGLLATMADPHWGAIVNRETVERYGDLHSVAVGTGPFILEEWKPEQETRLRKNPDYFEKGRPYVETLLLRIVSDEAAIVSGLRSGAIHHAMLEDPRSYEQVKGQPNLQVYRGPRLGYDFLSINQSRPPFDKIEVVQALSAAIDREECIKTVASGYAVLTAPATPAMKLWQLPEAQWRPYYKLDVQKAKALLAQAGYPNGFEATCLTISTFPTLFANAQVIQANLKRIGINLKVESADYARWVQRWQKRDFDLTLNTTSGYADPDAAFYRAFHS